MIKLLATSAAVAALFIAPAYALDVENQDGTEHTIVIVDSNQNTNHRLIAPGASLKGLCSTLCTVRIESDDDSYAAVTYDDQAVIKNRRLMVKPRS